jgi:hypothetical protein
VRRAQSVVGPTLQAAMYAHPRGYMQRSLSHQFGLLGYFWRRRIKSTSLPDVMLLAADDSTLYLYQARLFQRPQELGRWGLRTYDAVAGESGTMQRSLTLRLEALGDVELDVPIALGNRANAQVIDFVVGNARSTTAS